MITTYFIMVGGLYLSYVDGNDVYVMDGSGYSTYDYIYGIELDKKEKEALNPKQAKSVAKFLKDNGVENIRIIKMETPSVRRAEVSLEEL